MAIIPDGPAPYPPAKAVILIVETFRQRDMPTPVTTGVIERLGVTEALAPRVMKALRLYDLIDDDGNPTDQFVELAKASDADYRERFGAVLRAAYADVFRYVDPATAPIERVRDQFRHYSPRGQQERMLSLFLALCEYAGIIEKAPTKIPRANGTPKLEAAARTGARSAKQSARGRGQTGQSAGSGDAGGASGGGGKPGPTDGLDAAKARYVDLLLKRVSQEFDPGLLDRIERVLGIAATQEGGESSR